MQLGSIQISGETLQLQAAQYRHGGLALLLYDETGESYATLTVNVPGFLLEPGEFLVKTYSENAVLRQPALASGLFIDTLKRYQSGFASFEVWRLIPELESRLS